MNSVRPLVTITILAVVGVFLYMKINEGPARHAHGEADAWEQSPIDGPPPLAHSGAAHSHADSQAPQWPGSTTESAQPNVAPLAATSPPQLAQADAQLAPATPAASVPPVPAIPELADVPSPTDSGASAMAAAIPPTGLPANIPTAQYPGDPSAAASELASSGNEALTSVPVAPIPGSPDSAVAAALPAASSAALEHESTIASDNAMNAMGLGQNLNREPAPAAASSVSPPYAATPVGPATSPSPSAMVDRYGVGPVPATAPAAFDSTASTPVEPTFAAAWPAIQSALDRRELAHAHQLLSQWYGEPSLTPDEEERVAALLGQLAGTVVYSTEHQLEPARTVQPGETLEAIAQEYNVPWQLLAKINGVQRADAIQPGQQLKVVRGPFSALVLLRRSELTLMLGGRYAGRFPIMVPASSTVAEGQWLVEQKLVVPAAATIQASYSQAPAAVERAIVLRGEDPATQTPSAASPTLTIASGGAAASPTGTAPGIRVSPQDAAELADILSVGSRVVIQR